jgi:hypothetical protein
MPLALSPRDAAEPTNTKAVATAASALDMDCDSDPPPASPAQSLMPTTPDSQAQTPEA